ncbi:MAG: hypothetical protein ACJAV9_000033, partial [Urechidicola sp.]
MKVFYLSKIKQLNFSALIIILIGFTSCGTYQSAYSDDDGIYTTRDRNVSSDTNSNQDDNYFAQKLEEYQNIDNGDLITDVDGYSYQDQNGVYESNDSNYENSPWGYSNDVTININSNRGFGSFGNPFWNNGFNNWGFNNWGFNNWGFNNWGVNNWGYNNWGYNGWGFNNWGFNNWGFNNWGYGNRWNNGFYGFNNFNNGRFFGQPFGNNHYYRNYDSYGKRTAYNSRNNTTKRRVSSIANRRNSTISSKTNSTKRSTYNNSTRTRSVNENTQRTPTRR